MSDLMVEERSVDVEAAREAFAERLLGSVGGLIEVYAVHLGSRLGLYDAMADGAWIGSVALSERAGVAHRYTREWLEQQTVTGILEVEDETAPALERRYRLSEAHATVLTDEESLDYMAPFCRAAVGSLRPVDALVEAYRSGEGVPFEAYGRDFREGIASANRAMFLHQLGPEWLASVPDVDARLRRAGARVADVGCGCGWSSVGIARHYPGVRIDGFDLDEASVARAQEIVRGEGLGDRVRIERRDAAGAAPDETYDLVIALECIHDMGKPVEALRAMRALAGDDGIVIVVDERVGDRFTASGEGLEALLYGFSILHCLPVGLADGCGCGCSGTGTVMRRPELERYAREAGFGGVDVLPIEHFMFRFYRLV
jgi:SAM-dependent methyltransferase